MMAQHGLNQSALEARLARLEADYHTLQQQHWALKEAHHELSLRSTAGLNRETIANTLLSPGYRPEDPPDLLPALKAEYRMLGAWIRRQIDLLAAIAPQLRRLAESPAAALPQRRRGLRQKLLDAFTAVDCEADLVREMGRHILILLDNIPLYRLTAAIPLSETAPQDPLLQAPSPFYPTLCVLAGSSRQPRIIQQVPGRGAHPFDLSGDACLVFDVFCPEDRFCGLDLLLATHRRVNPSYVRVRIRDKSTGRLLRNIRFDALEVLNNCYHRVLFEPLETSAGATFRIEMAAAEHNRDAFIAVWCHSVMPDVYPEQPPRPLVTSTAINASPGAVAQDPPDPVLRHVLTDIQAQHTFVVQGLTPETSLPQLQAFLVHLETALQQARCTGQVQLYGRANAAVELYCRRQRIDLRDAATWMESLKRDSSRPYPGYVWFCNIAALPAPNLIQRASELLDALPHAAVLVPIEYHSKQLRAAFGLFQQNGMLKNPLHCITDAAHPWLGYRRTVEATSSELPIVRLAATGTIDVAPLTEYRTRVYQFNDLLQQLHRQGWQAVYDARLRYWHDAPPTLINDDTDVIGDAAVFKGRWDQALRTRPPVYGHPGVFFNPDGLFHILIIDVTLPAFDEDSGSLRMYNLLTMWAELGYRLTYFSDSLDSRRKYRHALEALGVEVFHSPYTIHEAFKHRHYDMVWIDRVDPGARYIPMVRLLCPQALIIYDTVDIHYVRMERQAAIANDARLLKQAAAARRQELANCILADHVVTVTDADGAHLQRALPNLKYTVIPNIHTVDFANAVAPYAERRGMVFIGNFNHPPNRDAVVAFLKEIFPIIHRTLPDLNFYVVGSNMPADMLALADTHVHLVGWVPEVAPEFARRRLFVSYLRYGSGMKGKLGQALMLGLPVVTTGIGAEGMGLQHEQTALIADEPHTFAAAVIRLYTDADLWAHLSSQGRRYIDGRYGAATVQKQLQGLMEECTRMIQP